MILMELFNTGVTYTMEDMSATFNIGNLYYKVIFETDDDPDFPETNDGVFYVTFGIDNSLSSGGVDTSITNSGNELLVFSTVLAIIKEFIQLHNPSVLKFSAEGASRIKLYNRMVHRLSPGWDVDIEDISANTKTYTLRQPT